MASLRCTREQIMTAIFNLLTPLSSTFNIISRYPIPNSGSLDPAQLPALFLMEDDETYTSNAQGAPKKRLQAYVFIYATFAPWDPTLAPGSALNPLIDAVETALLAQLPGQVQTLGGLVQNCYIDGKIVKSVGIVTQKPFAVIPLTIQLGI